MGAGEPVAGLDVDERDGLGDEPVQIDPLTVLRGLQDELRAVLDARRKRHPDCS